MKKLFFFIFPFLLFSCRNDEKSEKNSTYVKPSIDYKGKFRKGHVRKSVSNSPNAIKNRKRSKYYYETRGKYRKRKKRDD